MNELLKTYFNEYYEVEHCPISYKEDYFNQQHFINHMDKWQYMLDMAIAPEDIDTWIYIEAIAGRPVTFEQALHANNHLFTRHRMEAEQLLNILEELRRYC